MNQEKIRQVSDCELLQRYEKSRDEMAFAEIVRRHGPMVMRVTRRILGNADDASDAFQVAFMTVSSRSKQLRNKKFLAGWLHVVARTAAAGVKRSDKKWDERTKRMSDDLDSLSRNSPADPAAHVAKRELEQVVDEELGKLSLKLRQALVFCDLEGMTHAEAAKKLGLSTSTLSSQVTSGRRKLRERLIQRGVSLPAIGIAGYFAMERKATAALTSESIGATTTQSTLFATGKTAREIGVSDTVFRTATKVISTMTKAKIATYCLAALFLIGAIAGTGIGISIATAGTVLLEDFDDGVYADVWTISASNPGSLDASSGDLVLGPDDTSFEGIDVLAKSVGVDLYNVSARAQLKVTETGGASLIGVRSQNWDGDDAISYGIGVGYLPNYEGSIVMFYRSDSTLEQEFFPPVGGDVAHLDYDVRQEDTIVQIDVTGNELQGWYWRPGGPVPDEPQFQVTDDTYDESGAIVLVNSNRGWSEAPGTSQSIFRFIHVSEKHIPLAE